MRTLDMQSELTAPPVGQAVAIPSKARGLGLRIILGLGIVAALAVAVAGALLYLSGLATAEARALAPWPAGDVSAEDVATLDLTPLGLHVIGQGDARQIYGPIFDDGALIQYGAEGNLSVTVAALRYPTAQHASRDFLSLEDWAEDNCGWCLTTHSGAAGVIRCSYSDAHDRILWGDNWILDITATDGGQVAPSDLVDQIRDAAAAHWKGLSRKVKGGLSG